jgi:hypothetical protein
LSTNNITSVSPAALLNTRIQVLLLRANDLCFRASSAIDGGTAMRQPNRRPAEHFSFDARFRLDGEINPAPLPAALPLFATGLGALGSVYLFRKARSSFNHYWEGSGVYNVRLPK